ncbi:MAG TPA: PLP-dependent aminotransferase family protein [Candidatus Eisenbacteria bacterium]|nr:PLP-dependent aminotransferase family protein [Candidatus Eisenbacteria bacterium]
MATAPAILGTLALDRRAALPLQAQLYRTLREAVLSGRLVPGTRLPASRVLAGDLRIARNTVVAVFEQLVNEGYFESRVGSGTRVATIRPEALLHARPSSRVETPGPRPVLSRRGESLARVRRATGGVDIRAFQVGLPAVDAFPIETWARLLARRARTPTKGSLGYHYAAGHPALREAIASYLGAARGVVCRPAQVIVVAGAQAALDLACRMLLDPGDAAWIEEPGYLGARGALLAADARPIAVPVDAEGLDVAAGARLAPDAKVAYASPSHQMPLGVTMSLTRRLALIDWAARSGAWILEDDYDSEFRYDGRPLSAMQGIDASGRVIYVGGFSKTVFAALRVGYLVVPEALVDAFATGMRHTGHSAAVVVQAALADFIAEGHFAAHVRRMRTLYERRQTRLLRAAERRLAGLLTIGPSQAGMHVVGRLPRGVGDEAVAEAALRAGISVRPLSVHHLGPRREDGLLLGYAGVPEREIDRGVERLADAIAGVVDGAGRRG